VVAPAARSVPRLVFYCFGLDRGKSHCAPKGSRSPQPRTQPQQLQQPHAGAWLVHGRSFAPPSRQGDAEPRISGPAGMWRTFIVARPRSHGAGAGIWHQVGWAAQCACALEGLPALRDIERHAPWSQFIRSAVRCCPARTAQRCCCCMDTHALSRHSTGQTTHHTCVHSRLSKEVKDS
jgi:hypothetical protein